MGSYSSPTLADLDGDGDLDAFVGNKDGNTIYFENDPVLVADPAFTTDEDTSFTTGNVLDNDSDPDGDTLSVASFDTTGTLGLVTDNGDGTFNYDPNGQFDSLAGGETDTDSFSYTVSDGNGGTDTAIVTVTINGVNDPPVAVDDSASTLQDTAVDVLVLANDSDPDGDDLAIDSFSQGANGSVTLDDNGTPADTTDDFLVYTPDTGFSGLDSFTITISDGNGGTDTATVSLTVSPPLIGGINLGGLTDYLFFFADGNNDANWQGSTKGYVGDVAVDGISADERTSGDVAYGGTIYTNDTSLGDWQDIVAQNPTQAAVSAGETTRIADLETDLNNAFAQIDALSATAGTIPGTTVSWSDASSQDLDGLNTQNSTAELFVINITSDLKVSDQIEITGDAEDVFVLRWDDDLTTSGHQGQVKFQSGGGIVPLGGLAPSNFINVAGDLASSGGGSNPASPYPQGPRYDDGTGALITDGEDFDGGGFFTGYWLTTGNPDKNFETSSLSNAIFVGGWYTSSTKFSLTSGTSGVYVSPNADSLTPLTLVGGNDDDLLNGGTGDEELRGNLGDDILIGGKGSDTFIFAEGDGTDTIIDFSDGVDLIGLDGGLGFGDLSFSGNDISVTSSSEVLATLTGVDTTTLTADDFVMLY